MQQETYIEQYPNAFTKEFCDKIITRFEEMAKNNGVGGGKSLRKASDTRTVYDWAPHYDMFYHDPKLVEEFYSTMHKHYLTYMEKYGVLKESVGKHTPKGMSIKKRILSQKFRLLRR